MEKKKKKINPKEKGFDLTHQDQVQSIPEPVVHAPKEATDPAEALKHA